MNGEGIMARQPDDIFKLPVDEYMKVREERCHEALKYLGIYTVNSDLAPFIEGTWFKHYYEHKARNT